MATVRRRATRAVHLKFGGALRAQGVGGRPRAGALRAHLLCHRGGAAVRDVFSLEEVPPSLISPLVTGTEPVDPSTYVTFFRPWTQALECTRRGHGLLRERHVVGPRVPAAHSGAAPQLRLVVLSVDEARAPLVTEDSRIFELPTYLRTEHRAAEKAT